MEALLPFEAHPRVAIAVSGGPDSMALVSLTHQWVQARQGKIIALHVDHKLRSTSSAEALQVKKWLTEKGIECHILEWEHDSILSSIQKKAREARYQLLLNKCQELKILHLLVGHHQEDQYETYRMREGAQSGPWGLAGITRSQEFKYSRLLRPLLNFSKEELKQSLGEKEYIRDPSNEDLRFHRAQLRQQPETNKVEILRKIAELSETRLKEEKELACFFSLYVTLYEEGYAVLKPHFTQELPFPLALKLLSYLLRCMGGLSYCPRQKTIEGLYHKLQKNKALKPSTYARCQLYSKKGSILIIRENRSISPVSLTSSNTFLWDARFFVDQITQNAVDLGTKVDRLGSHGWTQVKKHYKGDLPPSVVMTLPCLWVKNQVVEVPHLGIYSFKNPLARIRFHPKNPLLGQLFC